MREFWEGSFGFCISKVVVVISISLVEEGQYIIFLRSFCLCLCNVWRVTIKSQHHPPPYPHPPSPPLQHPLLPYSLPQASPQVSRASHSSAKPAYTN